MTENPDPAQHPRDPERHRDKLLAWLIDAFALAMGALAIFRYKPDDTVGALVVFVGAYTLTSLLQGANWASLAAICESLVFALAPLIHLGTVATVPASFTGLVFTFLLPGIAQAYWVWELWPATGSLSHPLALMCAAWLVLLGIWIVARKMRVERVAQPAN